jgi:hypothetical protein
VGTSLTRLALVNIHQYNHVYGLLAMAVSKPIELVPDMIVWSFGNLCLAG